MLTPETLGAIPLSVSWYLVVVGSSWQSSACSPFTGISACLHKALLSVSSLPSVSLMRTFVITFRAHPDHPESSTHVKILNFITLQRPLFQIGNISRFSELACGHMFWGPLFTSLLPLWYGSLCTF